NLLEMTDTHGKTTYNYNSLNRLTQETNPNGLIVKYEYDVVGNRTKIIDPWNRVISYQYDGANRLAQVTDPQSKVTTYAYNKIGAPIEVNYPNGVKTAYSYDSLNRLTLLKAQGSTLINQFNYTYDNVGNRLTMTDKDGGVTSYEYDRLYRLSKASYPEGSVTSYSYDGVGNRLTMNGVSYAYDAGDRLLQAWAVTYGYDANGNMTGKTESGETTVYVYDYANRLTQLSTLKSQVLYAYDGYGRRISQLVKGSGLGIPEAQYTEYLWDGTNVLCEFYQNKGNPLEYVYGNGQLISRDDLLVLPVSKRVVYQNTHWFQQDGLRSVVNLTDSAGNTKLTYGYDAFGEITKEEGQAGWKRNSYTFTGKPYDPAAGMYYFGARWYEPCASRFITQDRWTWRPDDERVSMYLRP
ncbi:MAG: RHS repeat-associated core domain-containing protein, partial [Candidatus Desantisbacteria bacterium]